MRALVQVGACEDFRDVKGSRLRCGAVVLLGLGAIAGPLALGATQIWAYCALQVLVAVAACFGALPRRRGAQCCGSACCTTAGPSAAVPLPASVLKRVSPLSYRAQEAARVLTGGPTNACVSVDVSSTLCRATPVTDVGDAVVMAADFGQKQQRRQLL